MVFCLDSGDYMQTRNALIILERVLPHFPALIKLGQIIEKRVEKVIADEKHRRQDLFVLASSYMGQLKNKANEMLREADFHQPQSKSSPHDNAKGINGNTSTTPVVVIGEC